MQRVLARVALHACRGLAVPPMNRFAPCPSRRALCAWLSCSPTCPPRPAGRGQGWSSAACAAPPACWPSPPSHTSWRLHPPPPQIRSMIKRQQQGKYVSKVQSRQVRAGRTSELRPVGLCTGRAALGCRARKELLLVLPDHSWRQLPVALGTTIISPAAHRRCWLLARPFVTPCRPPLLQDRKLHVAAHPLPRDELGDVFK